MRGNDSFVADTSACPPGKGAQRHAPLHLVGLYHLDTAFRDHSSGAGDGAPTMTTFAGMEK